MFASTIAEPQSALPLTPIAAPAPVFQTFQDVGVSVESGFCSPHAMHVRAGAPSPYTRIGFFGPRATGGPTSIAKVPDSVKTLSALAGFPSLHIGRSTWSPFLRTGKIDRDSA